MEKERSQTGILGFDSLCNGGFINQSINLILGNAGSGKTTFLLQYLYNGATKFNENGLYVSFEQEASSLKETGKKLKMDFEKLESTNRCFFLKLDPDMTMKQIQKEVMKKIAKNDIKRLCFDPINIFSLSLPKEVSLRKQMYDFLSFLKQLDLCILIAGESDGEAGEATSPVFSEIIIFCKYLSDSVVELFSSGISGSGDRAIRIFKMRMSSHQRGPKGMQITDSGIKILKN